MNSKDFVFLVAEMRFAQRAYFSTRSKEALGLALQLEKKVDVAVSEMLEKEK